MGWRYTFQHWFCWRRTPLASPRTAGSDLCFHYRQPLHTWRAPRPLSPATNTWSMIVAGNLIIDHNFTGDNVTDDHCQTESKVVINYTVQLQWCWTQAGLIKQGIVIEQVRRQCRNFITTLLVLMVSGSTFLCMKHGWMDKGHKYM